MGICQTELPGGLRSKTTVVVFARRRRNLFKRLLKRRVSHPRLVLSACCLALTLAHSILAIAHQIPIESPPASELAKTQSPLPGSSRFLKFAPSVLRLRCNEQQHPVLDDIERRLREANQIRWGLAPDVSQRVAEYHRWKAEEQVIDLMTSLPDVLRIDATQGSATSTSPQPIVLDQTQRSMLLQIVTGAETREFSVVEWSLQREESDKSFTLEVADQGTTFVLVHLEDVPEGQLEAQLAVRGRSAAAPTHWHRFTFRSPTMGQLALDIEDENGKPTSALLQISSSISGTLWEPAGAIDLRPQLNNVVSQDIFEPGQGYTFFLPGTRRGRYWIVPPQLELPLPAGEWTLRLQRGPEHPVVEHAVHVTAGQWTRQNVCIQRWIDMPKRGWWSGDDHVHARLMSKADADRLLTYCQAVDIHVANILEMGDSARTYYSQRGFGPEFRAQRDNYWLVPGQEDPRSVLGHAIGLNLREKVRDLNQYLQNDLIAAQIHQQGGLYGHTHMGANACFVHRQMALFTPMDIVDFNSIMQAALGTELYYSMLNLGFRMTASAGADTPYGGTIGAVRVYAYTGDSAQLEPDAWFDAVKAGRTFVTNGPMLEFTVNDQLPGSTINLENAETLRVRAVARGHKGESTVERLRLVQFGRVVAETVSSSADDAELRLETEIDSANGCWLALHAIGRDGSEAHTTPVYVSVRGGRHWCREKVPELVEQQLAVLDEIEAALKESEQVVSNNPHPLDHWNRVNASQAEAVRLRVAESRAIYARLLQELKRTTNASVSTP